MKKINYASASQIKQYATEVEEVLVAIGVSGAMVTDRSCVGDFELLWYGRGTSDADKDIIIRDNCERISKVLGLEVQPLDLVCDIARKLFERKYK